MTASSPSFTACYYPIISALQKVDDILGPSREWHPGNEQQEYFFKNYLLPCLREIALIPEIKAIASFKVGELNKFLADNKFQIQLEPFPKKEDFGTASILDVAVEWCALGTPCDIRYRTGTYGGFRLTDREVAFYESSVLKTPLCEMKTKSGDAIFMAKLDTPLKGFDLMRKAEEVVAAVKKPIRDFDGLRSPDIKIDQEPDISWLLDAATYTDPDGDGSRDEYRLKQALQQTKIGQNKSGARDKSVVAVGMVFTTSIRMPQPDYVIDEPFLRILTRPGLSKPLTATYVGADDWKDPGDLAAM